MRNALVPVANIGSTISPYLVLLGVLMGSYELALFGALLFGGILLFQLVTLPVEFNASQRGIAMLSEGGYIAGGEEEGAAKAVLRAAAMTLRGGGAFGVRFLPAAAHDRGPLPAGLTKSKPI